MPTLLVILLLLASPSLHADPRQLQTAAAPAWLNSVGKLTVPGQKWRQGENHHYQEHCSATLLEGPNTGSAHFVLSAWHCLEHYRDLSLAIAFSLPRQTIERRAAVVISGGSMQADWALLRLDSPVTITTTVIPWAEPLQPGAAAVTSAGYSRDLPASLNGALLSYHSDCQVTAYTPSLVSTDCKAAKGASGGPLVSAIDGQIRLVGVLSSGDGQQLSQFVPATQFIRRIRPYLTR